MSLLWNFLIESVYINLQNHKFLISALRTWQFLMVQW